MGEGREGDSSGGAQGDGEEQGSDAKQEVALSRLEG